METNQKFIEDIIGKDETEDYIIDPKKHGILFSKSSPKFSSIFKSEDIVTLAQQYNDHDKNALESQSKYLKNTKHANFSILVTSIFGLLIMISSSLSFLINPEDYYYLYIILGFTSIISGGLGSRWLFIIRKGSLLEEWMSERAHAETFRIKYFKEICAKQANDSNLLRFQLEYFRRYQIDVQMNYYNKRSQDHKRDAEWALNCESVAVFLSTIATGLAGFLSTIDIRFSGFAAIGVLGTSLALYASSKEQMNQNRKNAERYRRTYSALMSIKGKLGDVRHAVDRGDHDTLMNFVDAVHEQMSLEHRQWIKSAKDINIAFDRLEKSIEKNKSINVA